MQLRAPHGIRDGTQASNPQHRGFFPQLLIIGVDLIAVILVGILIVIPFAVSMWMKYPVAVRITVKARQSSEDLAALQEALDTLPGVDFASVREGGEQVVLHLRGARIPWKRAIELARRHGYTLDGFQLTGLAGESLMDRFASLFVLAGIPIGFLLVYFWRRRRGAVKSLRALFPSVAWRPLALGGLLAGSLMSLDALISWLQQRVGLPHSDYAFIRELIGTTWWSMSPSPIVVVLLGPFAEELFFRGYIFDVLCRYHRIAAYLISASIFAAFHIQPAVMLPAFVIGLALAYAYHRTGNLAVSVTAHLVNNLVAVILLWRGG